MFLDLDSTIISITERLEPEDGAIKKGVYFIKEWGSLRIRIDSDNP